MTERSAAPRLADLTWPEAAARIRRDPRLIIPVGTCLQHGPHLPLDTDAVIITAVAEGIAARHEVLLAPTLPFGAGSDREQGYAGTASIRSKTLHRVLNEIVAAWEDQGIREIALLTAQGFGPNYRAMVSVIAERVRIRAVDLNTVDLSAHLAEPGLPEHAGELETSLMLYLSPGSVRLDAIVDTPVDSETLDVVMDGSEPLPLEGSPGVLGRPSAATAEKGREIYAHLVEYLGDRLFAGENKLDAP